MKKLYFLFLLFTTIFANAQAPFITTWEVDQSDLEISTPLEINGTTNYTIDFGDGTILTNQTQIVSHTYSSPGIYTVTISGNFDEISVSETNKGNLKTVEQWGDTVWSTMNSAFSGCSNLVINATDAPDLSQVTDMSNMFQDAVVMNQSINHWDVSNVTNMSYMFKDAISFNQLIDNWDVSNVIDMMSMFENAESFNQSLNNWNVSNVTSMNGMFGNCDMFNQPLNNWNVSGVAFMAGMFGGTKAFNQPLNDWDVSNVITMSGMFAGCVFNQPLDNWNVSNVTDMRFMFERNEIFNQPLNNWDTSSVTQMSSMFWKCNAFNQPLNNWNVSNVIGMNSMFLNAEVFNQPLNNWDVSNVEEMMSMFAGTIAFNQALNSWDVSNVKFMMAMFGNTRAFNQPLNNWDVSNVVNMSDMFTNAEVFNQPLNNWDVSNVTDMTRMFFRTHVFDQPLNNWDVSNVYNMESMFAESTSFNQDLSDWNFNTNVMFGYPFDGVAIGFLNDSGIDTYNYDALLLRFSQLELVDKYFNSKGLHYCDSGVRQYLINELGWQIEEDSLGAECIGNNIVGNIRLDENANGCDVNDIGVSAFLVSANNTNTAFTYSASASSEGAFTMKVPEGTYSIKLLNLPEYYTVAPATSEIVFGGVDEEETLNFCLTANETIHDLNVTLLPVEEARPGFETDYQLVVQNMGTQNVTTATVNLSFDDALQAFVSANPAPTATAANELTFTITNLEPFQSRIIDLKTKLFEPPVVNGNEISNFTATITPNNNDFTPNDNTFNLAQTIVNSFDPNDKRVLQGEEIFVSQTDDYLDYIIRFQNTGTASAITVKVKDVLNENLDWNTFQMISASHNYKVSIKEGNQVEFVFDNINLPHETANEPGSHGFIAYKIKPVANLQIGDVINGNTSSIYFDYNLPIITNSTTTTVVKDIEPIEISATITNVSCNGINDGTATVSVTGGSGTYSYVWSPSGGSEATATGLAAGDYTVIVNDGFDSETLSITITQPGAIVINNQPEDVVLVEGNNTMFSVVASNVEEYQWQVSSDGTNWDDISNGGTVPSYTGVTTNTLNITGMPLSYDGYKYRVLLSNGDNCITYSDVANAEVNAVAGIDSYDNLGIKIYPNPSKSLVFVDVPNIAGFTNLKITVLDINGRTLLEEPISDNLKNIDLQNFQSGMYIFTISSDKFRFSKYIIKE